MGVTFFATLPNKKKELASCIKGLKNEVDLPSDWIGVECRDLDWTGDYHAVFTAPQKETSFSAFDDFVKRNKRGKSSTTNIPSGITIRNGDTFMTMKALGGPENRFEVEIMLER